MTNDGEPSLRTSPFTPISSQHNWIYDVYISFAADTRRSFVSHLYKQLRSKGINVFKDDKLESFKLLEALESSKISIVVFSENFAASNRCLDEVVRIVECRERRGQIVVPVFYDVDPPDVFELKGRFGDVLEKLGDGRDKVEERCYSLKDVAVSSGSDRWVSENYEDDATLVDDIIKHVEDRLVHAPVDDNFVGAGSSVLDHYLLSSDEDDGNNFEMESQISATETDIRYPIDEECDSDIIESYITGKDPLVRGFVGMDSRVRDVTSLLSIEQPGVRVVGIWGMGGTGKTTIARIVYNNLAHQYEGSCYLECVNGDFSRLDAITLHKQLLSSLLVERNTSMDSSARSLPLMKERLRNRKVLIVLDDVKDLDQLKVLPERNDLGYESRIIIITRDKRLLSVYGVDGAYEVKCLNMSEALELFSRNAFKQDQPESEYLQMAKDIVRYVNGLPLALKVIGSDLYLRSIPEWESSLETLRVTQTSDLDIQKVLKASYDRMNNMEKQVFLDVACFFDGMNKNNVIEILDACGFYGTRSLQVLDNKSLIIIRHNKVFVHDLLQELAHDIVRRESVNPENHGGRLWYGEDLYNIPEQNKRVEGILLDMSKLSETDLNPSVFTGLPRLRLLKLYIPSTSTRRSNISLPGSISFLSDELRFLHWDAYPWKSLPLNFGLEKLVELRLPCSHIEQLWTGTLSLPSLKSIDISHSKLHVLPDLSGALNLKALNLEGCRNLIEITSISNLRKLEDLNLKDCSRLRSIGNIDKLKFLKKLKLTGCSKLIELPHLPKNIRYLFLSRTPIKQLPSSFEHLTKLVALDLSHSSIRSLPCSLSKFRNLKYFAVSGASNLLEMVPSVLVYWHYSLSKSLLFNAEYLVELNLAYCNVEEPWSGKQLLVNLRSLKLNYSELIRVPDLSQAHKLERFNVQGCSGMTDMSSIENLTKLDHLNLDHCKNLESLPSMIGLVSLIEVKISACSSLKELPELSDSIKYLYLIGIPIKELPSSIGHLTNLVKLDLTNCRKLESLPSSICDLKSLQYLVISGCSILLSLL